jgi:hypothetical protein
MKTVFSVIFIFATMCIADAVISYNPKDWTRFNLKFSAEGTLKDVYDAGLRPWLSPGSETSFLSFKHARVMVQTHEGDVLPEFPVEYADIYCLPDGRLKGIVMTSPPQPFASARALMLPWFPKIRKTERGIDEFFKIVKANQIGYEDPDFGKAPEGFHGEWIDGEKVDFGIGLTNNKHSDLPFRITFAIGWNKLRSPKDRATVHLESIKAPPGYENESMRAPKKWGPDSTLDKMRALDLETGESPEAVSEQRRNGERPPLKTEASSSFSTGAIESRSADSATESNSTIKPALRHLIFWPWIAGLVAVVLTIKAVFKRRS